MSWVAAGRAVLIRGGRTWCISDGEFYRKNVLLSALVNFLQHAGKSFLFRGDWCLQEGCFYGWLTDCFFFFFDYRFESSSHAISMSAYLREQRRELYSRSGELQGGEIDNALV